MCGLEINVADVGMSDQTTRCSGPYNIVPLKFEVPNVRYLPQELHIKDNDRERDLRVDRYLRS